MRKISKEIIKEFQEKYCNKCKSYVFCASEFIGCGCVDFEKFIKDKENKK
jgi:hypothetical protein